MGQIKLPAGAAAPPTPPSGYLAVYAKNDGLLYYKNDAGQEKVLTGGGGGGGEYRWSAQFLGNTFTQGNIIQFGPTYGSYVVSDANALSVRAMYANVLLNSTAFFNQAVWTLYKNGQPTAMGVTMGGGGLGVVSTTNIILGVVPGDVLEVFGSISGNPQQNDSIGADVTITLSNVGGQ